MPGRATVREWLGRTCGSVPWRVEPIVWDTLLAFVLLAIHTVGAVIVSRRAGSDALAIALILMACAPLALRG